MRVSDELEKVLNGEKSRRLRTWRKVDMVAISDL